MAGITNYEDERLTQVEAEKNTAMTDVKNQYDQMINESQQYYDEQIQASKDWAEAQQQAQQEQTDFAIQQVEQQKEQAEKDYKKEQSGAYVDYKKQTAEHGVNAEQQAMNGLMGTGYSESSKVSMYNTYQNRVATARESLNQANLNFDNQITQARLQNNVAQAEIALQAYQQQLEISLQGFQYQNDLLTAQMDRLQAMDDSYHNRYMDVLNQINTEKALEEQIRQFDEEMARLKAEDERAYALEIEQIKLQKAQLEEQKRQFDASVTAAQEEDEDAGMDISCGNSTITQQRKDYYFSNGYQPRFVNNSELSKLNGGTKVKDVFGDKFDAKISNQNIWQSADGHYYIWIGTHKIYMDVTDAFKSQSNEVISYFMN